MSDQYTCSCGGLGVIGFHGRWLCIDCMLEIARERRASKLERIMLIIDDPMLLYIVVSTMPYESYEQFQGAFSTRERAVKYATSRAFDEEVHVLEVRANEPQTSRVVWGRQTAPT